MNLFAPLFADADDWIKFAVFIVFILITAINKLLSWNKEQAAKKPPLPKPREAPPVPNVRRAQQDEIDEFLRRAADNLKPKRQTAKQPPKAPPPPPQKKQPPRRLVEIAQEVQELPVQKRESVAAHVQKHLSTEDFEVRASQLVDEDMRAGDRQREAHRQQVFGHRVGTLTDTSVFEAAPTEQAGNVVTQTAAAGLPLASLLASPESLRRAIVLNEILTRPEDRWSA
jgi:hypothetical protein